MALSIKRKLLLLTTALLTATILLSGTLAWQSINQEALNELRGAINPGGRLHDDFNNVSFDTHRDGTPKYTTKTYDKDVYVENFTSALDDGVQIYARVRLDEYMEIGPGAGTDSADKQVTVLGAPNARYDDRSTWTTYIPGNAYSEEFRAYWTLSFGGQTSYMPTFNKNKDSLAADINGTSAASFADYVDYTELENQEKTGFAIYDIDDDDEDELSNDRVELDAIIAGTQTLDAKYDGDVRTAQETHAVTNTIKGYVIPMEQWLSWEPDGCDQQPGDYWVLDSDGWAYWANPILPESATGLLLDQIARTTTLIESSEWYYGINVVAQFITSDGLGYEDHTGFFDTARGSAPTNEAMMLLTAIGVETNGADAPMPLAETAAQAGTEAELRAALADGSEHITLTADIALEQTVTVAQNAELHLNGHRLTAAPDFRGTALLAVCGSAWLDIDGGYMSAPEDGYAARTEDDSLLYIWNGDFVGGAGAVYAAGGGVAIAGGVFTLRDGGAGRLLDREPDSGAYITTYGGEFYNFDPSDAEGESLLPVGYTVTLRQDGADTVYMPVSEAESLSLDGETAQPSEPDGIGEDGGDDGLFAEAPVPQDEDDEPAPPEASGDGEPSPAVSGGIFGKADAEPSTEADGDGETAEEG